MDLSENEMATLCFLDLRVSIADNHPALQYRMDILSKAVWSGCSDVAVVNWFSLNPKQGLSELSVKSRVPFGGNNVPSSLRLHPINHTTTFLKCSQTTNKTATQQRFTWWRCWSKETFSLDHHSVRDDPKCSSLLFIASTNTESIGLLCQKSAFRTHWFPKYAPTLPLSWWQLMFDTCELTLAPSSFSATEPSSRINRLRSDSAAKKNLFWSARYLWQLQVNSNVRSLLTFHFLWFFLHLSSAFFLAHLGFPTSHRAIQRSDKNWFAS